MQVYSTVKKKISRLIASAVWLSFLVLLLLSNGCRRFTYYDGSDAHLTFSVDTLSFDTVFTSRGSSTRLFKIFNPYKQSIRIDNITLAGGENSSFRINIDGVPGIAFNDLEIAPQDSMYVFAEVTIDPDNRDNPFVIMDSIRFITAGNVQHVKLMAYGQNAYFHNREILCDEIWKNDKPHVIVGYAAVDSNCTLQILEGTRIFAGKGSFLLVAGTLEILGSSDSFVTFQGDRLEHFFDDLPGQWQGLIFVRSSHDNVVKYADINEAVSGIITGSTLAAVNDVASFDAEFNSNNVPDLTLESVVIRNTQEQGIYSFYSDIDAVNCLVYANGKNSVALLFGGSHELRNCTVANYGALGLDHKEPALRMSNFARQGNTDFTRPFRAQVYNSIVYGNIPVDTSRNAGELSIDSIDGGLTFDYFFDHFLVRSNMDFSDGAHFNSITSNANPEFEDPGDGVYELKETSPAIDKGDPALAPPFDMLGRPRTGLPDLGALEHQP